MCVCYGIPLSRAIDFDGSTVGLAFIGTLCSEHSTGVVQVYNRYKLSVQFPIFLECTGDKQSRTESRRKSQIWRPVSFNMLVWSDNSIRQIP